MLRNRRGSSERRLNRRYRFREIVVLPFSTLGRKRLWVGIRFRANRFTAPLAALYRRTIIRRCHVITVIGSFGKTTTTRAIAAILGQSPSRLGWGFNARGLLVEEVLHIHPRCPAKVIEVGIIDRGAMLRNARFLRPDSVVVTSIGAEHRTTLGSIREIRNEKADMVRRLPATGTAILNGDDVNVRWMASQTRASVTTFGFEEDNDIRAANYRSHGLSGGSFDLQVAGQSRTVHTKLVGCHQVYALLAAVAVSQTEHLDLEASLGSIDALLPTRRRLWPLHLESGADLLLDNYTSTFGTFDPALDVLKEIPAPHKMVVLGEVFEGHGKEDQIYRYLGLRVAQVADGAIFIGGDSNFRSFKQGAGTKGASIASAQRSMHEAARLLKERMTSQSVVLLKGTGSLGLERIALKLAGEDVGCDRIPCNVAETWGCDHCPSLK